MRGCYPVDKSFFSGKNKGLDVKKFVEGLNIGEDIKKEALEILKSLKIKFISDIYSFRVVVTLLKGVVGSDIGEQILDKMGSEIRYKEKLGEPYVSLGDRTLVIGARKQGTPMNAYRMMNSLLGFRFGYQQRHKVKEWLNISPRSQLYSELMGRRVEAETQVNRVLATLSDLYQQKHLLEHDIRKLEERMQNFKIAKESKGEKQEALKADFADLVDSYTGRHSLLQMQAENIFPTIMADFYRMTSEKDLLDKKHGGTGFLADIPESEKAMLRKKWYLYEQWKKEYEKVVEDKLKDLHMRINSIETSIKQTEEGIRPYIRTLIEIKGTEQEELDKLTDVQMVEGYSTSWRGIKLLCYKSVRETPEGEDSHYDVLIINVRHLTLASAEQPAAPGTGGEALILQFKEYLVCKHVFELAFQEQIKAKTEEVKRFIDLYTGKKSWKDEFEKIKPKLGQVEKIKKNKNLSKFGAVMGKSDGFYVPIEDIDELRAKMVGPPHTSPLYLDMKYGLGMFVMD